MANIIFAFESPDTCDIVFSDANHLVAVESSDTASFFTSGSIAVTESIDQGLFTIDSKLMNVEATESYDTASVNILTGETVQLAVVEATDTVSINISTEIKIGLVAVETTDVSSIHIIQGQAARITAVEAEDTVSINISTEIKISLVAVEGKDTSSLHIIQGQTVSITSVEAKEIGSVSITVSPLIVISSTEETDTASINILTGQIATLNAVEERDTALIQGHFEILANFSVTESKDTAYFNTLTGTVSSLVAVELTDTVIINVLTQSLATIAATETSDTAWFYSVQIPKTYVRKSIVMHLFNHAVSEYVNFNFNSLAFFKGFLIGTNEDGLFILGGKDDLGQPIQADVRTGIHDLGKDGIIAFPKEAWLVYRTDGQLELDVEVEEDGSPYPYIFERTHSNRITEVRETLGKGLTDRFYTFTLKNLSGSDFDLESLRILGNVMKEKRR